MKKRGDLFIHYFSTASPATPTTLTTFLYLHALYTTPACLSLSTVSLSLSLSLPLSHHRSKGTYSKKYSFCASDSLRSCVVTSRLEMIPTTVPSSSITGKCRNEFWRWACGAGRRVACGVWRVACGVWWGRGWEM